MITSIILWVVLGAIAGMIASAVMKSGNQSIVMDIVLGIIGAVIGGWVMNLVGFGGATGFNLYSLLVAIIGAIILIAVARMVRRTTA
jgi:uncharacterized membrane protein YeaQ/YmgE (transglycosylase-associated protein family)